MADWYADPDPRFQPAMRLITGITNARKCVVTTSFDHDYVSGLILRILVPKEYGMFQINNKVSEITVLGPTTFSLNIDTTSYDSFSAPAPPPYLNKTSTCVPVGNIQGVYDVAVRNVST